MINALHEVEIFSELCRKKVMTSVKNLAVDILGLPQAIYETVRLKYLLVNGLRLYWLFKFLAALKR